MVWQVQLDCSLVDPLSHPSVNWECMSTLHKYSGKFAKFCCQLYLSRCIHARHHILHSTHSTPMKWWLGPSNWKHHETSPGPAPHNIDSALMQFCTMSPSHRDKLIRTQVAARDIHSHLKRSTQPVTVVQWSHPASDHTTSCWRLSGQSAIGRMRSNSSAQVTRAERDIAPKLVL